MTLVMSTALMGTATASAATERLVLRIQDGLADAFASSSDACETRVFSLVAFEAVSDLAGNSEPTTEASIFARVSVANNCEGTQIRGEFIDVVPAESVVADLDQGAASVTFQAEKTFADGTEPQLVTVHIEVDWTGIGAITRQRSRFIENSDETLIVSRTNGQQRDASFEATVVVDDASYEFADIGRLAESDNGVLQITRL
ncbi:hypothetical protein [Nannocystis radixulma]|uniref:Uncharacterized protein n=1 Tax=Nannocystis radixulma TaxID=2995305 RepID=A0ABT5B9I7_9BACT|nr:hypothetical protein [Nannocystis radixulma]MDC0670796.1 hypothetical protein [Nannocystis radixulma]